jgi:hypothetical protein
MGAFGQTYLGGSLWPDYRLDMRPDCFEGEEKEAAEDHTLGKSLQVGPHAARLHWRPV